MHAAGSRLPTLPHEDGCGLMDVTPTRRCGLREGASSRGAGAAYPTSLPAVVHSDEGLRAPLRRVPMSTIATRTAGSAEE
jgi:hypothetical protein